MRQSLISKQTGSSGAGLRFSWLSLPDLCCQAAGGQPRQADGVAAAWVLLYTSAHIFDAIQDGDPPDPWWEPLGQGAALNVATGLLTSAWIVLGRIAGPALIVRRITEDFQRTVLLMASGQHLDLTGLDPSLDQAWAVAESKSGAFFALACRSGARMASVAEDVAEQFGVYGRYLGLMLQIDDDRLDVTSGLSEGGLPVAYWRAIGKPRWQAGSTEGDVATGLDESGARLYLDTKAAWLRARGLEALDIAGAATPARGQLSALICSLDPSAMPQG